MKPFSLFNFALATGIGSLLALSVAAAPPPVVTDNPDDHEDAHGLEIMPELLQRSDPSAALSAHDAATADIVSDAPTARVIKTCGKRHHRRLGARGLRLHRDFQYALRRRPRGRHLDLGRSQ